MLNKTNLRKYLERTKHYIQMGWCRGTLFKDSKNHDLYVESASVYGCRFEKLPTEIRKNAKRCCLEGAILLATPNVAKAKEVANYIQNKLSSNLYDTCLFSLNDKQKDKRKIIRILDSIIKDV